MKIVPVVRQAVLKDIDESYEDMLYWLSKTPQEPIAAVTELRSHSCYWDNAWINSSHKKKTQSMTLDQDFEDFIFLLDNYFYNP